MIRSSRLMCNITFILKPSNRGLFKRHFYTPNFWHLLAEKAPFEYGENDVKQFLFLYCIKAIRTQTDEYRTDAVLVTSTRRETVVLTINDHEICTTSKVKYFGVMLDARRSFLPNIHALCHKTGRVHAAFARTMANIGGPSQSRRLLLGKVVQAVIMYTAPTWHKSSYAKNVVKLI
uniref:Uncharacterized protein n=1 Tax=Glossina pallidipes TaxID=7398 RepID=A0A1A9ZBA5_GLOPL